jgi:hypothetical protein
LGVHDVQGDDVILFFLFGNCHLREYHQPNAEADFMWLGVHAVLGINGMLCIMGKELVGGWETKMTFGMEMNVAVPVAFFMYQAATNQRSKLLYMVLLGLFVMSVVATSSKRGAFLGLLALEAIVGCIRPEKSCRCLGICLVGLVLVAAPQEYWDRISSITDDNTMETGTAGQRMFTWGIGWEMFTANPIFGSVRETSRGRSVSTWEGELGKPSHWPVVRRTPSTLHCCPNWDLSE